MLINGHADADGFIGASLDRYRATGQHFAIRMATTPDERFQAAIGFRIRENLVGMVRQLSQNPPANWGTRPKMHAGGDQQGYDRRSDGEHDQPSLHALHESDRDSTQKAQSREYTQDS